MIELYNDDCLQVLPKLKDNSIDMILCDLPYGTTSCKWDTILPLGELWEQYKRLIKPKHAIVLFANEPFATMLRASNIEDYKYDWIWNKGKPSNFQVMNYQCGRVHELICVFSDGKACYTSNGNSMRYFPQKTKRDKPVKNGGGLNTCRMLNKNGMKKQHNTYTDKHPTSILDFPPVPPRDRLHPTQKPVELMEYLIKTYSLPGEVVLDNCMGVGTTGIACRNTDRRFVGIELEKEYYETAEKKLLL